MPAQLGLIERAPLPPAHPVLFSLPGRSHTTRVNIFTSKAFLLQNDTKSGNWTLPLDFFYIQHLVCKRKPNSCIFLYVSAKAAAVKTTLLCMSVCPDMVLLYARMGKDGGVMGGGGRKTLDAPETHRNVPFLDIFLPCFKVILFLDNFHSVEKTHCVQRVTNLLNNKHIHTIKVGILLKFSQSKSLSWNLEPQITPYGF